ncbi:MAG: CDP-6-deoxy-L-threo-D-glycero-4-hexulose-3-dehydrase reductase, partial [Pseudomonadota bacterium]
LPYGCKNGACGSCKAPLNSGTVSHIYDNTTVRTAESEQSALLCCASPTSDITITARLAAAEPDYPIKKLPSRIASINRIIPDVAIVKLQLPAAEKLAFKAGQYLEFILKDGSRRAYSMANAAHSLAEVPLNQIELHVRHTIGGLFTDALFGIEGSQLTIKEKDIMRIEVPQGTFYLRDADLDKPNQAMVMLASGTGFAPIKAMIEYSLIMGHTRPIDFYWGGRQLQDLYAHDLALSWAAQHSHIQYIPVLSEAKSESNWQGRTGLVHQAVMSDYPDLSQYQVYACGAPIVVSSAKHDFTTLCALPSDAFFADSFTSKADSVA